MTGFLPREWSLRHPEEDRVRAIRESTGLSDPAARILVNRGILDPAEAERFLSGSLQDVADPFLLKDLEKASARVVSAGRRREPVLIYADYDVDGATGSAVLFLFLREVFPELPIRIHQNHRVRDGYGLRTEVLGEAAREGFRLVVTVDCGITDLDAIRFAAGEGLEVIVTDHHTPGERLPPAFAVLDPKRPDCRFPEKDLAGVGVAFLLVCGIRRLLREEGRFSGGNGEPVLRRYLDLVALGTVADMVPLRRDNRLFVKAGIEEIRSRPRPGIRALLSVAGVDPSHVTETDLGFRIGPRLNAAGRVGDSQRSAALLVTEEPGTADRIARELHSDNAKRQREEERLLREAEEELRAVSPAGIPPAIVLARSGWHLGILGIVASRLAERYLRPTVLLTVEDGEARGSVRSAEGFPLLSALRDLSPLLRRFGGHSYAAGVALSAERLEAFREGMERIASRHAEAREAPPSLPVDAEISLREMSPAFLEEIDRLRPFGIGNEEPLLVCRNLWIERKRLFGGRGQHVRFDVSEGSRSFEAIFFHPAPTVAEPGQQVDLLFTPQWSVFRGTRSVRLLGRGMRRADGPPV
ncbi:MAG: single-stranded-DNA-specific exonuclease RecJ [Deltaproteobacteria bacterium]